MIIIIETVILCIAFFLICFWGTGTDNKNLKSYSSYPDEVQNRIKSIAEYQGKFKESNKVVTFSQNNSYRLRAGCKSDLAEKKYDRD